MTSKLIHPFVALVLMTGSYTVAITAAEKTIPNILLLVAEDMSSKVASFGDTTAITPNIDALARQGVRYTNTYTTAGVCAPSRAALITGVHQNTIGAQHMRSYNQGPADYIAVPPAQIKAFPELLRAAGYYTYAADKLDYQFSSSPLPGSGPVTLWDDEGSRGDVSWRKRPEQKPFFGMYAYMETHESGLFPRWVWPRSITHLVMATLQSWYHQGMDDQITPTQVEVPPYYPDTAAIRQDIAQQYNNIITMDLRVGELLKQLEEDGLSDNTIVIWTTDHGDGLPRAKRELFDSGIKVPMIIRWPEQYRPSHVSPGTIDKRMISFVDLAPTILAMAGVVAPDYLQGQDFSNQDNQRQYIYAARDRLDAYPDRQRAVRDSRYKYIRNYHESSPGAQHLAFRDTLNSMRELWSLSQNGELNETQQRWFSARPTEALYDTLADPHEINNLAKQTDQQSILKRMRDAYTQWQQQVNDLGALPELEMAQRFWPNEEQPITQPPNFTVAGEVLTINAAQSWDSMTYKINDQAWLLYSQPLKLKHGDTVTAKAVRYGWAESEETIQKL